MDERTYYQILGIPRHESGRGVRSAFRELARRYHPDRSGADATSAFRQIVEAYEVLSDPVRRARYDRSLGATDAAPPSEHGAAKMRSSAELPLRRPETSRVGKRPEPLIPELPRFGPPRGSAPEALISPGIYRSSRCHMEAPLWPRPRQPSALFELFCLVPSWHLR